MSTHKVYAIEFQSLNRTNSLSHDAEQECVMVGDNVSIAQSRKSSFTHNYFIWRALMALVSIALSRKSSFTPHPLYIQPILEAKFQLLNRAIHLSHFTKINNNTITDIVSIAQSRKSPFTLQGRFLRSTRSTSFNRSIAQIPFPT